MIERIARGDTAALHELVRRHRDTAWRVIRARTADDATAEDALQETFLGVWRGAGRFRGDADVRAWLLGMARRQAAKTWRKRVGEPDYYEPLTALGGRAGWAGDDPERAASRAEDVARLRSALAQLSPDDREVIALRDLEGMNAELAARDLGIGVPALKSRLHRARLRLMTVLREEQGGEHGGT